MGHCARKCCLDGSGIVHVQGNGPLDVMRWEQVFDARHRVLLGRHAASWLFYEAIGNFEPLYRNR